MIIKTFQRLNIYFGILDTCFWRKLDHVYTLTFFVNTESVEDTDIDPNLILKNFKIFCLEWWLWCINYIIIKLVLFGPLNGGPGDPKVPKMQKPDRFYRHGIRGKCARILCQLTPHSWNFGEFPFTWENWEIFANSFSRNF